MQLGEQRTGPAITGRRFTDHDAATVTEAPRGRAQRELGWTETASGHDVEAGIVAVGDPKDLRDHSENDFVRRFFLRAAETAGDVE